MNKLKISAILFWIFLMISGVTNLRAEEKIQQLSDEQNALDNDLIVLQVNLEDVEVLSRAFVAYKKKNEIFLPIIEFAKILNFPIEQNKNTKLIQGWFINENNLFLLDISHNEARSAGNKFKIEPESTIIINDEIFVDRKLLEKWFSLKIIYNPVAESLLIESLEVLPIEAKIKRDKNWEEFNQNKKNSKVEDPNIKTIKAPYKLVSIPFYDIRYGYQFNHDATNSSNSAKSQLNVLTSGDLLYLNSQLFASITNEKISNARLTLGRKDIDGNLLGSMHATEFSFGDIYTPEFPLISRIQTGRGGFISNYPNGYVTEFNKVPIRGNIQAGWEVELYRNDALLNFQKVGSDGIYEFLDVPLLYGANIIKLIFYGPFGQKREEIRQFIVNSDLLKEGKFYYRFAGNKNNENLISTPSSPNVLNKDDPKQGQNRHFAELAYWNY